MEGSQLSCEVCIISLSDGGTGVSRGSRAAKPGLGQRWHHCQAGIRKERNEGKVRQRRNKRQVKSDGINTNQAWLEKNCLLAETVFYSVYCFFF